MPEKKTNRMKGSISIEAAIALPVFICFILGIALLMRIFTTHSIIQHALNQTAEEMAEYSYIYSKSTSLEPIFGDVLAKTILQKNLGTGEADNADKSLKKMGVENGFSGFDLSQSKILANSKDIELVARYKLKTVLPIKIMPDLFIIQRSTARAWLDTVNISQAYGYEDFSSSIWELDPMTRGRVIQKLFGRNLPAAYPVITKFDEATGDATVVKSIDLSSATYQKPENLETRINNIIIGVAAFNGGKYGDFNIESYEIVHKKIIVVVPVGCLKHQMEQIFKQQALVASFYDISLEVLEYGEKPETS